MYSEAQTRKPIRTVFLFLATSLCAVLVCMAATWHHAPVTPMPGFQVYTYQNPFNVAVQASGTAVSKAAYILSRLATPQFIYGVLSLSALWLASAWYLEAGKKSKDQIHRQIIPVSNPEPKMNPLAVLPRPALRAQKQDTFQITVFGGTTKSCSVAHKRAATPCQSRFRPISLITGQARFPQF